jgi:predicted dehydrogenase
MNFPALSVAVHEYGVAAPTVEALPEFDRNQLFIDEANHFLACVEQRTQPVVNLDDGLQSLRMALAAKESMASGRLVTLGLGSAEFARA